MKADSVSLSDTETDLGLHINFKLSHNRTFKVKGEKGMLEPNKHVPQIEQIMDVRNVVVANINFLHFESFRELKGHDVNNIRTEETQDGKEMKVADVVFRFEKNLRVRLNQQICDWLSAKFDDAMCVWTGLKQMFRKIKKIRRSNSWTITQRLLDLEELERRLLLLLIFLNPLLMKMSR